MRTLAPVIVFAFNRPHHLRRTLTALTNCPEAAASNLIVVCDGPRNESDVAAVGEVREVATERAWCQNVEVVSRPQNVGLASSISSGVSEVCKENGRAIVVEDDVLVSRDFLRFMNHCLDRYSDSERVYQVSGHSFPALGYESSRGSSFLSFPTTIAWATWARSWSGYRECREAAFELGRDAALRNRFNLDGAYPYYRMLLRLMKKGKLGQSWGIHWYWTIFKANGLVLYPHQTLVKHFGDDGSGTNCGAAARHDDEWFEVENHCSSVPETPSLDRSYYAAVREYLSAQQTWIRRAERAMGRAFPGLNPSKPTFNEVV